MYSVEILFFSFLQAKTQILKMMIVSGLRIIDSNAQTGITWWNWTHANHILLMEG
jgi:hypothetical protein